MLGISNVNRNSLFSGLIFFLCFLILAVIALRPVFAFDAYWHLQMGKDFMENGLSPWIDHYSFSYLGKEISTIPVLFQVLLYQFVSFFGENEGFFFIRLFYVALLIVTLFVYFKKIKASWFIVLLILPLITFFIHIRLMVRPEIFSNILIVLSLLLYLKAQKTFDTRVLLQICLLLLFWVNYHSPIMGYIIFFGLFLDKAINKIVNKDESFSWNYWFLWGVIILLIGFIRPGGLHFVVTMLNLLTDDFGKYTQEYVPSYLVYSKEMVVSISWVLSAYAVLWSLAKKQYGLAIIAVIFFYFSLSTLRLITATMLVNLCILALYFSQASFYRHFAVIRPSIKKSLIAVGVLIFLVTGHALYKVTLDSVKKNNDKAAVSAQRYPTQIVDYLKQYHVGGNILNIMHLGGYLINKLAPEFKIYFDGRTNILYPIDFVKHNVALVDESNEVDEAIRQRDLENIIRQYNVEYAIYPNTVDRYLLLHNNRKLHLNFADENFILFSSDRKNMFPLSSMMLVFPSCWDDDWSLEVQKEILLSDELFENKDYTIKYVLDLLRDYLSYENKRQFFDKLELETLHSDSIRRVAFYLALKSQDVEEISRLYNSIKVKTEYDVLLFIYTLVKKEKYREAEDMMYYFYVITKYVKKKHVSFDKIEIMVHVLDILEKNDELKKFEYSYKGELEEKLKEANYSKDEVLSFDYICK